MEGILVEEYTGASMPDADLEGFFEGWLERPSASTVRALLAGSDLCFIARTDEGRLVGFVTAITDRVLLPTSRSWKSFPVSDAEASAPSSCGRSSFASKGSTWWT